jgi:HEAT repeats
VKLLIFVCAILLLAVILGYSTLGPGLSVKGLVDSADEIIVGKIERVRQTGTGEIDYYGVKYPRSDYTADINVDETIKGEPVPHKFVLSFSRPSSDPWGNVAERHLEPNTYRVIFLNKTSSGYRFASPYYPSIPASPTACGENWHVQLGKDAYHAVLQRVLELPCTDSTSGEKQSALFVLQWNQDSDAAPFLKAALNLPAVKSDATLRMCIVGDLLHWKDLSVLPIAEEDLFDPSVKSSFWPKSNLVLAISSLEPRTSIPLLARVLRSPDAQDRLAAASFLQYTNSPKALPILLSALDDSDRQVQFAVMQSLGNLTNQYQWRPTTIDSDSHWNACIEHWREFEARLATSGK